MVLGRAARTLMFALSAAAVSGLVHAAAHATPSEAPPAASLANVPRDKVHELEDAVEHAMRPFLSYPGVAVGVVTRDGLVVARCYGVHNRDTGVRVTPKSVFRLGSITKVFAGLALLALRDEGKLTLDDPVVKYLPELTRVVRPASDSLAVTLRQVVTHTSGLPRDLPHGNTSTEAELFRVVRAAKIELAPAQRTQYSNLAPALIGPIVHRVSGVPFRDYVAARILRPLGMTSTVWELKDVEPARRALGYFPPKEGEREKYERSFVEWRMGAAEAFGGLYSSIEDMAKFISLELTVTGDLEIGAAVKRRSLIESQTLASRGNMGLPRHGVSWVLSDDADRGLRVEHTGATDEYSASVAFYPQRGVGVVVMTNTHAPWAIEAVTRKILKKAADLGIGSAN